MKLLLCFPVLLLATTQHGIAAVAALGDFELSDQHARPRKYVFPKSKVTVITVADHKGSDQLAPWVARLYGRYQQRIDIDGIADVSMIPKPFHGLLRSEFRKRLTYSVMLDWNGAVVRQFGFRAGVANLYVIDRRGRILKTITGPVSDAAMAELSRGIDRAIALSAARE